MIDETDGEPPVEDCKGMALVTLRDVRFAIAAACRLIKAGKLSPQTGGVLMNGYATLAKMLQDQRDSLWTKRAEVLWKERQGKPENAGAEENH